MRGDYFDIKTVANGVIKVEQIHEEELDKLIDKGGYEGNLNDGVPNLKVVIKGKNIVLDWSEAASLGYALLRVAEVSYYG